MLDEAIKYSYNDVAVEPAIISDIKHRKECNPFDSNGYLPIFTAPMSSVINEKNWNVFDSNKVYPIIPRTVSFDSRLKFLETEKTWVAFGLSEFKSLFVDTDGGNKKYHVLIDIANGHMKELYDQISKAKEKYPEMIVMAGNIANPETYRYISETYKGAIDYIRIGIGSGSGCITSSNVSIHYPMASLIDDCKYVKDGNYFAPKIVADGGIRNYSDVIKALALGADYVMIGGLFSSCIESCAGTYILNDNGEYIRMFDYQVKDFLENPESQYRDKVYKKFYGMASREGQIDLNGSKTHTSEGIAKYIKVKYRLSQWTENMADYLRSAMSYTSNNTLDQFINNTDCTIISNNTYSSLNK